MARGTHHVVHNSKGGWDVKRGGAQRSSGHYETKAAAVKAGRAISKNQKTEFLIHGKDGVNGKYFSRKNGIYFSRNAANYFPEFAAFYFPESMSCSI